MSDVSSDTAAVRGDELEAGRELDALVAEMVMGWAITAPIDPACDHAVGTNRDGSSARRNFGRAPGSSRDDVLPAYSTDIASAWDVVEKMKERHMVTLKGGPNDEGGCEDWVCDVMAYGYRPFQDQAWSARADTAPLAIVKAALAATPTTAPVTPSGEDE